LNGPAVQRWPTAGHGSVAHDFRFDSEPQSLKSCAAAMATFVETEGLRWFDRFHRPESLLGAVSPLAPHAKEALRRSLQDPEHAMDSPMTLQLFGVSSGSLG
jgi:hypothetical protein